MRNNWVALLIIFFLFLTIGLFFLSESISHKEKKTLKVKYRDRAEGMVMNPDGIAVPKGSSRHVRRRSSALQRLIPKKTNNTRPRRQSTRTTEGTSAERTSAEVEQERKRITGDHLRRESSRRESMRVSSMGPQVQK